jgi:type I restriction enzyme S subunit
MSFPRYPKYKTSGVEWIGEVPEHWEVKRLKTVASHNDDVLDESTAPDTAIVYVDISSVDGVNGITAKDSMLFSAAPSRARRRVKHGDVIVSTVRTYLRAIARIRNPEDNLIVSTGFAVIRARSELDPDFVGYLLSASHFVEQVIVRSTGVSYPAINASELVGIPVTVPPVPEQTLIAAFLDKETAKIDELVAEQRRLMELLKEKRQAVISQAVTKGLNPHAPLKPSGIEWLGDIPEHWSVLQLNRLIQARRRITYGIVQPGDWDELGRFMIRGQDYSFGWAQPETIFKVSDEVEIPYRRARLMTNDLVLTIVGAGVGNIAIVPQWLEGANITQTTARIAVDSSKADPRFVAAVLHGPIGKRSVELYAKGAAQPGLNLEHVRIFPVTMPPLNEQHEIATFIDRETSVFDALTAEAQRAIDLLKERRTALISAAVTGQIDVRPSLKKEAP